MIFGVFVQCDGTDLRWSNKFSATGKRLLQIGTEQNGTYIRDPFFQDAVNGKRRGKMDAVQAGKPVKMEAAQRGFDAGLKALSRCEGFCLMKNFLTGCVKNN